MTESMSLRDEVEADLSDALVGRLHDQLKSPRDPDVFRDRLVHILTRYELYFLRTAKTPKKERRRQISNLLNKAEQFLGVLEAIDAEVKQSIEVSLNSMVFEKWIQEEEFDLSTPLPEDDQSLMQSSAATHRIVDVCRNELDNFDATKGEQRKSGYPALDQLVIDMAALYEMETGASAKSHCRRDETSEDEYSGGFFVMAKTLLDNYAPRSYSSAQALGKRIERLLSKK